MAEALGPHRWVLSTPATPQSHPSSEQTEGPGVSLHFSFPLISWNPSGVCRWLQGDLQLARCQQCIRHSNNHSPGLRTQNMSAALLIPAAGCAGEKPGGWTGLCKALESKIRMNSASFPSLGSSKAPNPALSVCFVTKGCGSDSLPLVGWGRGQTVQKVAQVLGEVFALRRRQQPENGA